MSAWPDNWVTLTHPEWTALADEPPEYLKVYLGLKKLADFQSWVVRCKEADIRSLLVTAPKKGRHSTQEAVTRKTLRNVVDKLEVLGLLERRKDVGDMAFFLPMGKQGLVRAEHEGPMRGQGGAKEDAHEGPQNSLQKQADTAHEGPEQKNMSADDDPMRGPLQINRESSKTPPPTPRGGLAGFEQFWSAYPKKRAKGQAEKAWAKLKVNEAMATKIVQAVEAAKRSRDWQKDGGQFVPYPATWLNARGWEDDIAANSPVNGFDFLAGAF